MIRSTSKVILVRNGMILLNRCRHADGRIYYDLPGGGQHPYETMEDAARREVFEETGYSVGNLLFAALGEEIYSDPDMRQRFPDYTHRIYHIFVGTTKDQAPAAPTETDFSMEASVWVALDALADLPELYPKALPVHLPQILSGTGAVFLGTYRNDGTDT